MKIEVQGGYEKGGYEFNVLETPSTKSYQFESLSKFEIGNDTYWHGYIKGSEIKAQKLTQLNEEQINNFFIKNKDAFLVTDKIKNLDLLTQKFNFTDRMFVEVFNIKDYLITIKFSFEGKT